MQPLVRTALAALALIVSTAGATAATPVPPRLDRERLQAFLLQYRDLLYSQKTVDCSAAPDPCTINVPVDIVPLTFDGVTADYCIARFPQEIVYTNTASTNPSKRIVWELNYTAVPTGSGKTYDVEFEKASGILVPKGNSQFTPGKRSAGPGKPDVKTQYYMVNKHKAKTTAVYLPVVTFTNRVNAEEVGVCGTGDPIAVNKD